MPSKMGWAQERKSFKFLQQQVVF
uniref:Uncharacterized protein n=1 Tax=Anguilla anguilla TaxID=7936 RepID=A0A0E9RLJ8_ANGAN